MGIIPWSPSPRSYYFTVTPTQFNINIYRLIKPKGIIMLLDKLLGNQAVIISLDVDNSLFERLNQIAEAGFSLVELYSTDEKLLSQAISRFPMLKIGAGGILDTQQLENCYKAGVHFITSPGYLPALAQTASVYSVNFLPGVATLSEAMAAMNMGCQYIRPFPANLSFCTLLNRCFPNLKLFPAEIEWEEAEHFLNLPAVASVGIHNPDKKQLQTLATSILV